MFSAMSPKPNPNELFDDLQGQLVKGDVERIKGLLYNKPIAPSDLERCGKSFTAICRELVKKNTIKPDILDFSFLEEMFETMGLLVLKDRVSNFVATAKSSRAAKKGSSSGNPQSPGEAKSTGSSTQTRSKTNRAHTQKRKGSKTSHGHQRSAKRSKSKDRPTEGKSGCSGNGGTASGSNPKSSGTQSISSSKQKGGITGIGNSPVFNAKHVVIKQTFHTSDQAVKNEKGKDDGDADPQEQESSDSDD